MQNFTCTTPKRFLDFQVEPHKRDMAMRRIYGGLCRNWFLIDPLHYLSSRSAFGFEFAEILLIENEFEAKI
jgi:hypothetical protein